MIFHDDVLLFTTTSYFSLSTANTQDGARLDIVMNGFGGGGVRACICRCWGPFHGTDRNTISRNGTEQMELVPFIFIVRTMDHGKLGYTYSYYMHDIVD